MWGILFWHNTNYWDIIFFQGNDAENVTLAELCTFACVWLISVWAHPGPSWGLNFLGPHPANRKKFGSDYFLKYFSIRNV